MHIYGINPVLEAIRAGSVLRVQVCASEGKRVGEIVKLAQWRGIAVDNVDRAALDRLARRGVHQGVVAEIGTTREYDVAGLVRAATGPALIVVLDGVEDPQNLGAILRTVDAAGADGVIRQTRRAARLGGAAAKASAGALAYVKVADVVNIARALDELKKAGVWTIGLAADVTRRYDDVDLALPSAFVVGAEGTGLRRLVREKCDWVVSIPLMGHVQSLNVSVAVGVALFEAVRQRRRGTEPGATT